MIGFVKKIRWVLWSEILTFMEFFVVFFPSERIGYLLRRMYWRARLNIGHNFRIDRGAIVQNPELVCIGSFFVLGENAIIGAGECKGIFIGDYVGIARNTYIRSANHKVSDLNQHTWMQGHECKVICYRDKEYSVVIEDDVWIGANCVILTGSKLGKGCIVSAGSIVSGEFADYSIIMGNPARVIGNRIKKTDKMAKNE